MTVSAVNLSSPSMANIDPQNFIDNIGLRILKMIGERFHNFGKIIYAESELSDSSVYYLIRGKTQLADGTQKAMDLAYDLIAIKLQIEADKGEYAGIKPKRQEMNEAKELIGRMELMMGIDELLGEIGVAVAVIPAILKAEGVSKMTDSTLLKLVTVDSLREEKKIYPHFFSKKQTCLLV